MKVGIFYNSIRNPSKFSNKVMLMDNFKQGVLANGDNVIEFKSHHLDIKELDAGFVLGYTLENNFRKQIIDKLSNQNCPRIFVDSNILHYARKEHEWHRYSLDSVYPNDGIYFFNSIDKTKWQSYSSWHGVNLKPWRSHGTHILILCQRPKGWNMFKNNQWVWVDKIIDQIRKYSTRPIVLRMHPGDGTKDIMTPILNKRYGSSITISKNENIRDDLLDCWCTVGYNSTPNVVSSIEGVPGYIEDALHSWAKDVAFSDISQIENPPMPDRSDWINKIANIHWSNDEVISGKLWSEIRNYILTSR
jgi:hypothetical protein